MEKYREIKGDLIKLAQEGEFEVITHGCNCMCVMGSGIAPQMAKAFGCDKFDLEKVGHYKISTHANINKLGSIDFQALRLYDLTLPPFLVNALTYPEYEKSEQIIYVINSYTQYAPGSNPIKETHPPLDYQALALCLRKINFLFKGKTIGLPMIGCGLARGDWSIVKQIIQEELKDMDVTVVIWEKK